MYTPSFSMAIAMAISMAMSQKVWLQCVTIPIHRDARHTQAARKGSTLPTYTCTVYRMLLQ